jgi:colicin import membrane protein
MESTGDQVRSFALSVLMHAFVVLMVWFGIDWLFPPHDVQAAGEPLQATLRVSQADLQKARAAIDKAAKAEEAAPKPKPQPPQPKPEPRPQDSPTPPQLKPQEQLARPDEEVQPAVSRLATKPPPPEPVDHEQERKQKQEQAELTEDVAKQQEAERRQRLRQQMLDIQKQREEAERRTKLEEQRMQQLADLASAKPKPVEAAPSPKAGNGARGPDDSLMAKYKLAMRQTADYNWNHTGAQELTVCKVRFTQIPGGEVINVEFINCPYDAEGREFVERALKKTPMPYSGFETVFLRQAELSFCYPREKCQP